MIFNSVTYLLFLALVVGAYWHLPRQPRHILLFAASLVFYGFWSIPFLAVMLTSVVTDYIAAQKIHAAEEERIKRRWMYASLAINLGLLFFFKYYFFLSDNFASLASIFGVEAAFPLINIILPIGISFYTFQSISYTIDVRRGFITPEKNFILFGVYVMFFPQLIAGPILRAKEVLPQLDLRPTFNSKQFSDGLRRILAGLFLKVVLADQIAPFVDDMYAQDPAYLGPLDTMTMAFMFGLQIFFDFSAYSHIAIGSAKLMGIEFPENFRFPYSAASPRDFWRRWHISLGSWIRDYIYLPLAGAKVKDRSTGGIGAAAVQSTITKRRLVIALFLTWAIMGLWHGAAWAFVLWGLWHATAIQIGRLLPAIKPGRLAPVLKFLGWGATLTAAMLAWVPFRTQDVGQALALWGNLFALDRLTSLGFRENAYLVTALVMAATLLAPFLWAQYQRRIAPHSRTFAVIEFVGLTTISLLVLVYLRPVSQFIYFQF